MSFSYIQCIPEGYSQGTYNHKKYGITKETTNSGKSYKVYAEELGGNDIISLNYYCTVTDEYLKPCEMPAEKVTHFLEHVTIIK